MLRVALVSLLSVTVAGCSLTSGGSGKAGGQAPRDRAFTDVVTIRYGTADPAVVQSNFFTELARVSRGHVRVVPVAYDPWAPDVEQHVARDLITGKLDVADIATRAWESFGVGGMRAFQSPFLLTSASLLDRATADPRIAGPLLRALQQVGVTGLAIQPAGVRYLFARNRALNSPEALAGARVRINKSQLSSEIMRALAARPTSAIANPDAVVAALESGRLDAVEASMRVAMSNGYVTAAPYVGAPIFAKATATAANSERLRALGPQVGAWIRTAARRAAATARARDERPDWQAACGGGLRAKPSTAAQIDAFHRALLPVHTKLDGDPVAALAIDRIGLLAVHAPALDAWAHCGKDRPPASQREVLDGVYEFDISVGDVARVGETAGNDGHYRVEIGNGRYAIVHTGSSDNEPTRTRQGWELARDPVEVGNVLIAGDVATLRPETSITNGSKPKVYRFALFRDRLKWMHASGSPDFLMSTHPWRRIGS